VADPGPGSALDGEHGRCGVVLQESDIAFGKAANLTGAVYERLRAEIVRGRLRPNERLVEAELAERLQVSRTPVREGLQRLAADGLVVSRRRGWVVYEYTIDQIRDIYETRAALEGFAARLATERATPERLHDIAAVLLDSAGILRAPREHLVDVNDRFHDAIVEASGNRQLVAFIKRNRLYYFNYRVAAMYSDDEAAASRDQHERLAEALLRRDGDRAEAISREHIATALRVLQDKLQ
jgi:DNA-binding GntR family transcriptional regulator